MVGGADGNGKVNVINVNTTEGSGKAQDLAQVQAEKEKSEKEAKKLAHVNKSLAEDKAKMTKELNEKDHQIAKLLQMGIGSSNGHGANGSLKSNGAGAGGKSDELGIQLATMKDMLNDARREAQNLREENMKLQPGANGAGFAPATRAGANGNRYSDAARADAAGVFPGANAVDQEFSTTEACKQLKRCMELSLANQNLLDQLFVARKDTSNELEKADQK